MAAIRTITAQTIMTEIDRMKLVSAVLMKCRKIQPQTTDEIICLKYIELQKVVDVAAYLNNQELRIVTEKNTQRKYIANDITAIFAKANNAFDGRHEIHALAKDIYLYYKGKVNWNQIVHLCERINGILGIYFYLNKDIS